MMLLLMLKEGGGVGKRGRRGEETAPPLLKKAFVPRAFSATLCRMIFFGGAFAGAVAAATPMVYGALANGVAILLLAAAGVEATTDLLILHVLPGNSLDVAFKLLCRLTNGILTWSSESSGHVVLGEVRETGLLTGLVEELLDVVPFVPLHDFVLEGFEKLFGDGKDVFPWQDICLANQVRLKTQFILYNNVHCIFMIDENLLAHALLEVGERLIPVAKFLIFARLWLRPQVSRSFGYYVMGPDVLADHKATMSLSVLS